MKQGEKMSLAGSFKLDAGGVEVGITASHEHTVEQSWSYPSGPCEYCSPEICFPAGRLTEWQVTPFYGIGAYSYKQVIFAPGARSEIHKNCKHAPEHCGCDDDTSVRRAEPSGATLACVGPRAGGVTMLLSTTYFVRPQAHHMPDIEEQALFFHGLMTNPATKKWVPNLHFSDLRGAHVPILSDGKATGRIALLSADVVDRSLGAIRLEPSTVLPLLILGPNMDSSLHVRLLDEHGDTLMEPELLGSGRHGELRLWHFTIPGHTRDDGQTGELLIEYSVKRENADGSIPISLSERVLLMANSPAASREEPISQRKAIKHRKTRRKEGPNS